MENSRISILILLLISSLTNCQKKIEPLEYQNDNLIQNLGIGLIQIVSPKEKIIVYGDSRLLKINSKKLKVGSNFIPLLNKPDYNILFFTCIEKNNNFYKIAVSRNKYAYIRPSPNIIFYSWNNFLKKHLTSVESKDLKNNTPRISIDGKPISIKNWNSDDDIQIIEVKNEWLKAKNLTQNNQIFWIRWRDDKTLKIYLNLLI